MSGTEERIDVASRGLLGDKLNWTGNHFLNESVINNLFRHEVEAICFTKKEAPDSKSLKEVLGRYYGVDPAWVSVGARSSQILDTLFRSFPTTRLLTSSPIFTWHI